MPFQSGNDNEEDTVSYKGFANDQLLITPEDLKKRLEDPSLCMVDTRATHEYAAGHIPGAIHLDFFNISLADTTPRVFDAFMSMMGYLMFSRGISFDKTVVFYESMTSMRAARGFWFGEYLGLKDARLLDGGLAAWTSAGHPVSTECGKPARGTLDPKPMPERHIGAEELKEVLGRDDYVILDVRSDDEYYGRVARAARAGSIPGSVHIEYTENLDESGAFRPAAELKALYQGAGITPDKTVVCYCQGGYRSSLTYLALRLLGYADVRNYIGSWKEWGDREDLPLEIPESE
jgi:thiosulfate/3-mercaptopyruvate sulfurtransferase